jgi:16S rRNA processing protein RimM
VKLQPAYLVLGEILRPHGVRGELRVRLMTEYPERIAKLKTIYLADSPEPTKPPTPYAVKGMRMNSGYGLLKLAGIDERNGADRLRGLLVLIDIEHAVPLEAGEFYLYQLIGLTVQTAEGETLGKLEEVLETGANDVYIVDSPRYGEVLIPATEEAIVKTDIGAGVMTVKLPEGLLTAPLPDDDEQV